MIGSRLPEIGKELPTDATTMAATSSFGLEHLASSRGNPLTAGGCGTDVDDYRALQVLAPQPEATQEGVFVFP
jgi:hypothetical protein